VKIAGKKMSKRGSIGAKYLAMDKTRIAMPQK
jgi:hypothetical protein